MLVDYPTNGKRQHPEVEVTDKTVQGCRERVRARPVSEMSVVAQKGRLKMVTPARVNIIQFKCHPKVGATVSEVAKGALSLPDVDVPSEPKLSAIPLPSLCLTG
ncbi:hypothetical protein KIF24_16210 [Micromonospora sp. Llam7]|uniref:hypothetical protein n=1 Tax=Micromonospora tarapacensis TaxID=2835305 RepID=UPI001C832EF3|nr:hypothetical protein [Micromonospora tarapacensis]MBX7267420.1 hypothetical protein [Micromonospora tarapacensis]